MDSATIAKPGVAATKTEDSVKADDSVKIDGSVKIDDSIKTDDSAIIAKPGVTATKTDNFVIIANLGVTATTLTPGELSKIYLGKKRVWKDGTKIIPINREVGSNARTIFTARVLRKRQSALNSYWNKMASSGITPPLVQKSDQAVLAFVQNVSGAIGYVSASTELKDVKVLAEIK